MRAKVTEVGPPITLVVSGLGPDFAVAPHLTSDVLAEGQAWAPPIIQQLPGGLLVMETSLDYRNWMVLTQVEWNEGDQALLVWYVLQWWLGWSTASHHPDLLVWYWVGLVHQPNWWCLTKWMQCLTPYLSSVLLLMTASHRTEWPNLGQSLWLLLGQLCHLKPCLPQLVPAMHEVVVVSLSHFWWRSLAFPHNTKSQASHLLVFLSRDWDGECDGVLPNASGSSGPFWPLGGVRVWPSVWILIPGFWLSRSLDLADIDMKTVAVNWKSR